MVEPGTLIKILKQAHPNAECSLVYKTPFQLLSATILSAQCTDERVNKVTPILFARFPNADAMSRASLEELETLVKTTGFYRAKAKSLLGMSQILVRDHSGKVPACIDALVQLPGVGRKTANVVLGNAFGVPAGVVVDTHVKRLSFRMGLTRQTDPEKVEKDLNRKFNVKHWTLLPHLLIHHGREICMARKPRCDICPLLMHCPRKGLPKLK